MWCAFRATAAVISHFQPDDPWDKERVWLHIRALRERMGTRVTREPRGGACGFEYMDALGRCGLRAVRLAHEVLGQDKWNRYRTWDDARAILDERDEHPAYAGSVYLVHQPGHVFAYIPRDLGQCLYNIERSRVTYVHRVERVPGFVPLPQVEL